jgi:hypothetical protein
MSIFCAFMVLGIGFPIYPSPLGFLNYDELPGSNSDNYIRRLALYH